MTTSTFATDRSPSFSPADSRDDPWFDQGLTIPYEGQTRMRLLFTNGVSNLSVRVGASETALIRGHFDGIVPSVSAAADEVWIRHPHLGVGDWLRGLVAGYGFDAGGTLVLHPGVAWELVFRGGASELDVDLRHGRVTGLELSGGASQVHLALPAPATVVPLSIRGGASEVAICRPANVPFGVQVRGGVSCFEIDGRQIGAAGGTISLDSDGWSTAAARYDLQLTGGASELSVST